MPKKITKSTTTSTTRGTKDVARPVCRNGTVDKRYTTPQFTNKNGTRDRRTTLTRLRK